MARGFTLIELLVVMAILALMAGLVAPALQRAVPAQAARTAAGEVAAALRRARSEAIAGNREIAVAFDLAARSFRVGGERSAARLPDGVPLTLHTATSELVTDAVGAIRFYPDGSATGGAVTVGPRRIAVAWLTGDVRIEE